MRSLEESLRPLRDILRGGQLSFLCRIWSREHPFGLPQQAWPRELESLLSKDERIAFDLFFRGEPVSADAAIETLGHDCVETLKERGILRAENDVLRTAGYLLRQELGFYAFAGFDVSPSTREDVQIHLGYDSLAFGDALSYAPAGKRALEVCAGSGILSMSLSRNYERVTAVELIEPVSKVAEVNVALSGLSGRVEIRRGNLFDPVAGERFDLIIANPPFSPNDFTSSEDPVGAGGRDGLDVARAIWADAPEYLEPGGRLMVVLGMLGDEKAPFAWPELERLALNLGWQIGILDLQETKPIDRLYIPSIIDEKVDERIEQIRGAAAAAGASHYHVAILSMARGNVPGVFRVGMKKSAQQYMVQAIKNLRRENASRRR